MISKSDISQIPSHIAECDYPVSMVVVSQNSFLALTKHELVILALVLLGILALEDGTG